MKTLTRLYRTILAAFFFSFTLLSDHPAKAVTGDPVLINEVLASHTGTDNTGGLSNYTARRV